MKYLYVYPEKCTGCKQCALACSLSKFGECNPRKSAISIVRDEFEGYEYPIVCLQCEDAPCVAMCPQNAFYREQGVVMFNGDRCIGCRLCVVLCPYSAITWLGAALVKCDLCEGDPKCVRYCSTGAIQYLEETVELGKRRKELVQKLLLRL